MRHAVIVDYGMGNLYSVLRACLHVGLEARISDDPYEVRGARGLILPGVGGMPEAMRSLKDRGLAEAVTEAVAVGIPLFGVCLGMQLLLERGSEFHEHEGLGLIPGGVEPVLGLDERGAPLRVPHIGWNTMEVVGRSGVETLATTMLHGVRTDAHMYFVHSYRVQPDDPEHVIGTTRYGSARFCSMIASGRILGCQFHPEKSGPDGLKIYANFRKILDALAT